MNNEELLLWLIKSKKMSQRAAKDVLSRCGRIYRMLDINELDSSSMGQLIACDEYQNCSMFIKSQLKRTITLYLEYKEYNEDSYNE